MLGEGFTMCVAVSASGSLLSIVDVPQNIVLSGGSTMFEFFGRRLQRDLKQIVDARISQSETSSGNLMKVCPGYS